MDVTSHAESSSKRLDASRTIRCDAFTMNRDQNTASHKETAAIRKTHRLFRPKEALWFLTVLACVLIVFLSPLKNELTHIREINERLDNVGPTAELVFMSGAAFVTALGFPRMLIYPIGGIAFGFFWGLVWSVTALLLGGYIPFCYARWGGRSWIIRKWPRMGRLANYFHERSYRTVVLFRILPMPGFLTNAFLGITHIKHRSFLLGTFLGSIPPGIPATLLGSSIIEEHRITQIVYATSSIILFIVTWFVIPFCLRKHPNIRLLKEALTENDDR